MFNSFHSNRSVQPRPIILNLVLVLLLAGLGLMAVLLAFHPVEVRAMQGPANNSLIWPLSGSATPDVVSSPFGPRSLFDQSGYDYHPGIDIAAPPDTPVHVITDGVVTEAGWLSESSGLVVFVYHPGLNLYTTYLHLNSVLVVTGQVVSQGQIIGLVGNTGSTNLYHLHFEVRLPLMDYPASTRNPMGYLPRPDAAAPTLHIGVLQTEPIYSPTVTLVITTPRSELDLNQIRVRLYDWATGAMIDDQFVDFNQRLHTGADTLDQDGIQLIPAHFNADTAEYQLTARFYNLHSLDSFTMTAEAVDLAGHTSTVTAVAIDMTPPAPINPLTARQQPDGSIELQWLAPGDSGYVGQALAYEGRYAGQPIYEFNWSSATPLSNPPTPGPAGLSQTWTIPGPLPQPVYFAMQARDQEGNLSTLPQIIFLPIILKPN
jgi:hypothetical protein